MNTREGAYIYNSIRLAIVGNSFLTNSEYGLGLLNVSETGISGNIFSENYEGIFASVSRILKIKGNLIENNTWDGVGIYVYFTIQN